MELENVVNKDICCHAKIMISVFASLSSCPQEKIGLRYANWYVIGEFALTLEDISTILGLLILLIENLWNI